MNWDWEKLQQKQKERSTGGGSIKPPQMDDLVEKFKENLETTEPRVLQLFVDDKGRYQFWQNTNAPKKIENPHFYQQKLSYIHQNPLRKGYVAAPEHWLWSSANPASPLTFKLFEA